MEKEVVFDNKLHNCWKVTGIIYNVFMPQSIIKEKNKIIQYTDPSGFVIRSEN